MKMVLVFFEEKILSSGKSRAFINDTPVSLAQLKDLGERLIDIHSQYQNLLLGNDKFQLHVIDVWGHNNDLLLQYKSDFQNYKLAKKKLLKLQEERVEWKKEEDYSKVSALSTCRCPVKWRRTGNS